MVSSTAASMAVLMTALVAQHGVEYLFMATILTVDEMTDEKTSKDKEMKGQGIANTVTGFFGGMAGCALIAESVINVKVGGRGRLSTVVAGLMLLLLVFVLDDVLNSIPIAALVGVMMMVCIEIFDWKYFRNIRRMPLTHTVIMLTTVAIVVVTHDLTKGVIAGVLLSVIDVCIPLRKRSFTFMRSSRGTRKFITYAVSFSSSQAINSLIGLTSMMR